MENIGLVEWLVSVLPGSPFVELLEYLESDDMEPYLGYLNFFVPVSSLITVIQIWLVAVTGFWLYSAVARWLGVID